MSEQKNSGAGSVRGASSDAEASSCGTPDATGGGNGIVVHYHLKPRRLYEVNPREGDHTHVWTREEPWGRVPSVTQAIGVVDKSGPLQHYAATQTLEGVVALARRRRKRDEKPYLPWNPDKLLGLLKEQRLMYYNHTRQRQDFGTDLHTIWEDYAEGKVPRPQDWPEDRRGAIQSMARFIISHRPVFVESERVVGSARYGYGGRLDSVAMLSVGDRTGLIDVKNSKACFPRQHWPQLNGYENGLVECGGKRPDFLAILRLDPDGDEAQLIEVPPEHRHLDNFLVLLEAHRSQHPIPERICTLCSEPATTRKPHPHLCKAHSEEAKAAATVMANAEDDA